MTKNAAVEEPDLLGEAVTKLIETRPRPFFVQVGGFDGVSFDPLRRQIVEKNLSGIIVEPIPQYFQKLKTLYASTPEVMPVNCAVAETDGERTIWQFNPLAVERGLLPPHFAGISSFLMEDLLKETGVLGRSSPNQETTEALRKLLIPVTVPCRTMTGLLGDHGVKQVDILQIDTEGYDFIILKLFDFEKYRPGVVHYEHQHLQPADRAAAEVLLRSHGYTIRRNVYDTLAVLETAAAQPPRSAALRNLAMGLVAEGRATDGLLILEHLAALQPGDLETLKPLARLLAAQGRTLDSLARLIELRDAAFDLAPVLREIEEQMPAAVTRFNQHLAAKEIAEAEKYASALATLVPRNKALLNAAMSCNLVLGRRDAASKYAAALRALDEIPAPEVPLNEPPQTAPDIERRVKIALAPQNDVHPLVQLRNIHDAASEVLCEPLTTQSAQLVEELVAAGRALAIQVPEGSDWQVWEKHYRVMIEAINIPAVLGPTPEGVREQKIEIATSTGTAVNWTELRTATAKAGTQAVFFAAADRAYIDKYARWYIKSILKHCDVPCTIVVHVIGGAEKLREIAKSIGVRDKRLFFSADRFDATSIVTKCYDAPPKGQSEKPIAHLQSVRFLMLGQVLQKLKRPIFVSDIDLILQRGVSDLLQRAGGFDIMVNQNEASRHAGARLTANLLLANPTSNAALFLRFLRNYLERELAKPVVTRWIDQLALLMARQHLVLRGKEPKIGCFDTNSDINNIMYRSFQQNPFRFLSLYHGFDTSTLEEEADMAAAPGSGGKESGRPKRASRAA